MTLEERLAAIAPLVRAVWAAEKEASLAFEALRLMGKEVWDASSDGYALADPLEENGKTYWQRFSACGSPDGTRGSVRFGKKHPDGKIWDGGAPSVGIISNLEVSSELLATRAVGERTLRAWREWERRYEALGEAKRQRDAAAEACFSSAGEEVR